MNQLQLGLLGMVDGPGAIPVEEVAKARTYREAVVAGWLHRRVKGMSMRTLAEVTGMRASHLSDYLSPVGIDSKGRERREMPAKFLPKFEAAMGNTFVTQWLMEESRRAVHEALAAAA
jgi:hypothetical protein